MSKLTMRVAVLCPTLAGQAPPGLDQQGLLEVDLLLEAWGCPRFLLLPTAKETNRPDSFSQRIKKRT